MPEAAKGPLAGVRVFDATLMLVGRWCSMQLGALGADVIHIEPPDFVLGRGNSEGPPNSPDEVLKNPQTWPIAGILPSIYGTAQGHISINLNKRGVVIDYKKPDELAYAYDLIKTCDVLVQNMRPGVMTRLGLGYDKLREINPQLIYCSLSGWGQRGPMVRIGGNDGVIATGSGWTSINGANADQWESYRFVTQLDANTGNHGAQAIIAALLARHRTGLGQHIEVSMFEAAVSMQTARAAEYFATGQAPRPMGAAIPTNVPHDAFRTEEGEYIAVAAVTEQQWRALCEAIDLPGLADDPAYRTNADRVANRDQLTEILAAKFASKPLYWWYQLLNKVGVPAGRRMSMDELWFNQQVVENRYIPEIETSRWGKLHVAGAPWHFSETPEQMKGPPYPNEHNDEVKAEVYQLLAAKAANGHSASTNGHTNGHTPGLSPERPLEGFLVVDLSQGLAGPHGSMLMSDAGARVIKVEPPEGDYLRRQGPPFIGEDAAAFVALNRGKQGVVIDPASTADKELLQGLLRKADVIIEDWHSDYSRELGLDYDAVHADNPRAIYLSITGWGENGPWAERPQAELIAQFAAEVTAGFGKVGDPPIRVGNSIAHAYTGIFSFQAVAAALLSREKTGKGQQIFVSLFGSLVFMRQYHITAHNNPDAWNGRLLDYYSRPNYSKARSFECRDGRVMFDARPNDLDQVKAIVEKLGVDMTSIGEIPADIVGKAASSPEARGFWEKVVSQCDVIPVISAVEDVMGRGVAPLFDYESLFKSPQAEAVQLSTEIQDPARGTYRVVSPPWAFVTPDKPKLAPAPTLDQHRDSIVAEAGLSAAATSSR